MIELDHSTLNAAPPPEPAKAMTADVLLKLEIQQRRRFAGPNQERQRVSSGCDILDELFDGGDAMEGGRGLERGIVVGVSAEGREDEGILLSLNLLASILIPHLSTAKRSTPIAQIIDTTGSFPLSLLAQVLKSRISSQLTTHQTSKLPNDEQINTHLQKSLELISISRVFDIPGLWEVLREINDLPTPPTPTPPAPGQSSADWPSTSESAGQAADETNVSLPASFILGKERPETVGEEEGIQILIIHTITPLINDLFARKEKSEAHTLLTTLSTTLHTLSKQSNILTLLHNTTIPTTPTIPQTKSKPNTTPSLFPSTTQKPSLGQIFTPLPTLHILISTLLTTQPSAESLYPQDQDPSSQTHTHHTHTNTHTTSHPPQPQNPTHHSNQNQNKKVKVTPKTCHVLEILKDETPSLPPSTNKFGSREQKWVPLALSSQKTGFERVFEGSVWVGKTSIAKDGDGGDIAEGEEGVERKEEGRMERREVLGVGGVGGVAKIYGFGGRRV